MAKKMACNHRNLRCCATQFLVLCTAVFTGVSAAGCLAVGQNTVNQIEFVNELVIPPLAVSRLDPSGRRVFALQAREGHKEFRPGVRTRTWGINGGHLGPTLRAARGETVIVNVLNQLDEATTMHWHGMHLPARMDGGPHQPIASGRTWSPTWTVDQPAATLWYHPHPHGSTARHVYRGLAGMFIIDDESSGSFGLPAEYGVNDIPVIVQDVAFDRDGQLDRRRRWFNQVGFLGDTILVNGTIAPYIEVVDDRIRLRLLNASTARVYDFGFSDDRPFLLVATDGGLLPAPYETTRTMLSPGERAEIVVTLDPSTRTVLRSYPPSLGSDFANNRFSGGSDSFDIVELRAATELRASPEVPTHLVEVPSVNALEAVQIRRFDVTTRAINGQDMDMGRIDAVVDAGTVEIWEVTGISVPHNFHVHGVQFQVLDIDGSPPPPPLQGWKDTVYLMPDVTTRIIITFPDEADPKRPYMYHCHLLRHEDRGAMGQFVIVGPGSGAKR